MCVGGIHRLYDVQPDMAVFAKSMANGYPMSAVLGTESVMQAAQTTFISSTNWTDRVGPTAALATLKKYQRDKVEKHINEMGKEVKEIWRGSAEAARININISGLPSLAAFAFQSPKSKEMNTLFTIEMLKEGFLGFRQFKPSQAHTKLEVNKYADAVGKVFQRLASDPDCLTLDTGVQHSGFQRLTKE